MSQSDKFERLLIFVDALVLTVRPREDNGELALHALFMRRDSEPCQGQWSLIGGGMRPSIHRTHEELLMSKIKEKAGIAPSYIEQVYTSYGVDRDARGPSQTTLYVCIMPMIIDNTPDYELKSGSNASDLKWFPIHNKTVDLDFAFDHKSIIGLGIDRLFSKSLYTDVLLNFLPDIFTMSDIIRVYSAFNRKMSHKVARDRFVKTGLILESEYKAKSGGRFSECFTRTNDEIHEFDRSLR